MKILYGIQGTGHGHLSRAREILPELSKYVSVDVLISGHGCRLDLQNPVKYRKHGISLTYDSNGGVSVMETLRGVKPIRFINDVHSVPVSEYDLIVSDYEPVTAWSALTAGVPSVALSHQASFLSALTPRPPNRSMMAEAILQHFAPADHTVGFHFSRYDTFIEPPIVRSEIRNLNPLKENHITVYMPAYHHTILTGIFSRLKQVDWHIFSPDCERRLRKNNVVIEPVSNNAFLKSFESCRGIMSSAGFETSAEAMYLNKKLLVVPIRNQYEQLCNGAALQEMGVTVLSSLDDSDPIIWNWLENERTVSLREVADPARVVNRILEAKSPREKSEILPTGFLRKNDPNPKQGDGR